MIYHVCKKMEGMVPTHHFHGPKDPSPTEMATVAGARCQVFVALGTARAASGWPCYSTGREDLEYSWPVAWCWRFQKKWNNRNFCFPNWDLEVSFSFSNQFCEILRDEQWLQFRWSRAKLVARWHHSLPQSRVGATQRSCWWHGTHALPVPFWKNKKNNEKERSRPGIIHLFDIFAILDRNKTILISAFFTWIPCCRVIGSHLGALFVTAVAEPWPRKVTSLSADPYLADFVDVELLGQWRRFPLNRWLLTQDILRVVERSNIQISTSRIWEAGCFIFCPKVSFLYTFWHFSFFFQWIFQIPTFFDRTSPKGRLRGERLGSLHVAAPSHGRPHTEALHRGRSLWRLRTGDGLPGSPGRCHQVFFRGFCWMKTVFVCLFYKKKMMG